MIYPVQDFDKYYSAQGFGAPTSYGFHDGEDLNIYTGGNTDFGKELIAIASGKIVQIHNHTSGTNFGKHLWLEIEGAWGKRYVHYAHMDKIFVIAGQQVSEGQVIGTIGTSGTTFAHCHFCISKTLEGDNIPNNRNELTQWENPFIFMSQWINSKPTPITDQTQLPIGGDWGIMELQAVRSKLNDQKRRIQELEQQPPGPIFTKPAAIHFFELAKIFES